LIEGKLGALCFPSTPSASGEAFPYSYRIDEAKLV